VTETLAKQNKTWKQKLYNVYYTKEQPLDTCFRAWFQFPRFLTCTWSYLPEVM